MYSSTLSEMGLSNLLPPALTDDRRCVHVKQDGTRCSAYQVSGSALCAFHDPQMRQVCAEGRKAGGTRTAITRARKKLASLPVEVPEFSLSCVEDVTRALAHVFTLVARGSIDSRTANSLALLSGAILKSLELSTLERKLADLEEGRFNGTFNYPASAR